MENKIFFQDVIEDVEKITGRLTLNQKRELDKLINETISFYLESG
jgi:hypothetical protein